MKMNHTRHTVLLGMFTALVLLLGLTPLGLIHLGFINVTILCVPVVIGTIMLGLKSGLVLGAAFGTISALSAFGIYGTPSALAAALVAKSPILALILCYVPRLLVPVSVHLVYRALSHGKATALPVPLAAAAGSLTNTLFYLGLMLLFYVLMGIEYDKLLLLIGGTGLIAGSMEAVAAAVISTPVVAALNHYCKVSR